LTKLDTPDANFDKAIMLTHSTMQIRAAQPAEDGILAHHFYQMWLDNQVTPDVIVANWYDTVLQFIEQARQTLNYQAFVAVSDQAIIGSAGGQKFAGPYPNLFQPTYRCDGYIWGVYVEPAYRHQGIGKQLTRRSLQHLKSIGCTHAVLNASPFGKSLYEQLGFMDSNLMRLTLSEVET
jgi:GNAT superfamily N-acetyltransferase